MSDTKKTVVAPPFFPSKAFGKKFFALSVAAGLMVLSSCSDNGTNGTNGTGFETTNVEAGAEQCKSANDLTKKIKPIIGGEIAAFSVPDVSKKMPLLEFVDRDGKKSSTSTFEGKTVLFNLWATWCAPCRKEMPAFDALEKEFGGKNFAVVPVSVDRGGPEKPLAFFDEIGLKNLPFFQDETMGVFNILKSQSLAFGLPVTVLLDKEGCILGALNGPAEWAGQDAKNLIKIVLDNNG